MGIKGKRRRMRLREERLAQEQQQRRQQSGTSGDDSDGMDDEGEGGEEASVPPPFPGFAPPPLNANGELRVKKSELYRLRDERYLERLREEHANRRTSHLQAGRKRRRSGSDTDDDEDEVGEEDEGGVGKGRRLGTKATGYTSAAVRKVERELLGHSFADEDALMASEPRRVSADGTAAAAAAPHRRARHANSHSPEELLAAEQALIAKRNKAGKGALFSHPRIKLDPDIAAALRHEGFLRMTLIQQRAIPYALEGFDLLGQARTGSGKTLAFCVPLLHRTREFVRQNPSVTAALALAPTKELCVQTYDVLLSVVQHVPPSAAVFTVQLITGGTKVAEERRRLQAGPSVVVGTPGRVHDHVLHCRGWELGRLRCLVLDEADRMLADGFQRDLDAVLARIPAGRQTLLFSATNSKSVHELARLSLSRSPVFVDTVAPTPMLLTTTSAMVDDPDAGPIQMVPMAPYENFADPEADGAEHDAQTTTAAAAEGTGEGASMAGEAEAIPDTLEQFCHVVPLEQRLLSLYAFVKRVARTQKAMIFCSTVASTIFHCQMMASVGFHDDVVMLHGHMKHRQRVETFRIFNEWETGVLFCTDVAARGLDIPNVSWILQYDPPLDPTEYIHRIGRTARAGSVGRSLLFLAPEEIKFVGYLHQFGIRLEKYPAPARLPRLQEKFEHVLQLDPIVAKSAVGAFRAHVGAYQSHILKETFDVARLDLDRLAAAFALTATPTVTLPQGGAAAARGGGKGGPSAEAKKAEYVKGKLRSLNRRRKEALRLYESNKTKQQWSGGSFIGMAKPV